MSPACRPVSSDGRAGNPRVLMAASQATPQAVVVRAAAAMRSGASSDGRCSIPAAA